MPTVKNIDKFISALAPATLRESWDNDGVMVCGAPSKEVKKILVCLDVTEQAIDYAVTNSFDVIVSHHPFIFRKLSRVTDKTYSLMEKLFKNDITVLSYHTRLDCTEGGVNDALASALGLQNIVGFGGERNDFGRMGTLEKEMTGKDFALYLKQKLGCDIKCVYGDKMIKKVAVLGGGGRDFMYDAMSEGADAYVTSEFQHNHYMEAKMYDFAIFDCGHYYTENVVCKPFADTISKEFSDVEVKVFDISCPYICY